MAKIKNITVGLLLVLACFCANGQSNLRQRVIDTALSQVGVREATGHNDGVAVEKYLKVCGLGKGYAWCAAFVSWIYYVNQVTTFKTAWAPGWFPSSRVNKPGVTPQPGDVGGLWMNGRISHVFFIYQWSEKVTKTIEGNTNEAGSREGDGVYVKRRLTRQIYKTAHWVN